MSHEREDENANERQRLDTRIRLRDTRTVFNATQDFAALKQTFVLLPFRPMGERESSRHTDDPVPRPALHTAKTLRQESSVLFSHLRVRARGNARRPLETETESALSLGCPFVRSVVGRSFAQSVGN